jgi:hypothetical protein
LIANGLEVISCGANAFADKQSFGPIMEDVDQVSLISSRYGSCFCLLYGKESSND